MIKKLEKFYYRRAFFPGFFGIFFNPFFLARTGLRNAMVRFAPELEGRLLDVGCGRQPYRELFVVSAYVGLEIDSEASRKREMADYYYDGKSFPFHDDEFDSVLCNQVLEHVFNPDEFLSEIKRVLKPGGRLLLTVPFVWDEHEQPYDYARYSSFGLIALFKQNGLKIIEHQKTCSNASIIFQLVNAYIYKITRELPWPIRGLVIVTIMSFFNILGLVFGFLLPKNPDLFLDQVVLAEKKN